MRQPVRGVDFGRRRHKRSRYPTWQYSTYPPTFQLWWRKKFRTETPLKRPLCTVSDGFSPCDTPNFRSSRQASSIPLFGIGITKKKSSHVNRIRLVIRLADSTRSSCQTYCMAPTVAQPCVAVLRLVRLVIGVLAFCHASWRKPGATVKACIYAGQFLI